MKVDQLAFNHRTQLLATVAPLTLIYVHKEKNFETNHRMFFFFSFISYHLRPCDNFFFLFSCYWWDELHEWHHKFLFFSFSFRLTSILDDRWKHISTILAQLFHPIFVIWFTIKKLTGWRKKCINLVSFIGAFSFNRPLFYRKSP